MFLVSPILDLAARVVGPRHAHALYLQRLSRWRTFEPEFYLLDHLVDPARAAIDVGANEGIYTGRMSQLCPRVHCFEPIPWLVDALRLKLDDNVVVHPCAASNRQGSAELRIPYHDGVAFDGSSTLEPDNPLPGSNGVKTVTCALERLDDVVQEPIGFIKIDVEGHEVAVIEGATRILRDDKPVLLIESERRHNATAPESLFELLAAQGYVGFFLQNLQIKALGTFDRDVHQRVYNLRRDGQIYINNFIFVPGHG